MNRLPWAIPAAWLLLLAAAHQPASASEADCQPVSVVIMHARAASAEVKLDGEILFKGPIALENPSQGISAEREVCLPRGKALVEILADGAARSATVMIRRDTRFIYIDMGLSPRVEATDKPALLD